MVETIFVQISAMLDQFAINSRLYSALVIPHTLVPGRDSLMPRERCPVCAIEITHKNLARHIKLRHGIRYKFCYKCRKLVPGHLYAEHKALHESGQLETIPGAGDAQLEMMDNLDSCRSDEEDGDAIEIPEEMLDQALDSSGSKKKDETFRANTSMTKLESLMGKEFKHPRRKCQICGYSVSYSNFKRHMRNAHPNELGEDPSMGDMNDMGGVEGVEMGMMGHHMDDSDRMSYNASAGGGEETDNVELVDGYVECKRCGDHVMKEFLGSHMRMEHGESEVANVKESSPRDIIMRACPECGIEMRSDSIIKHCKMKHKVSSKLITQIFEFIDWKINLIICLYCRRLTDIVLLPQSTFLRNLLILTRGNMKMENWMVKLILKMERIKSLIHQKMMMTRNL